MMQNVVTAMITFWDELFICRQGQGTKMRLKGNNAVIYIYGTKPHQFVAQSRTLENVKLHLMAIPFLLHS